MIFVFAYNLSNIRLLYATHYKTLGSYRRFFPLVSAFFSGETTLRRFVETPIKKCGKVAQRRFNKRRRVTQNAETRVPEINIIFRHTGFLSKRRYVFIVKEYKLAFVKTPVCIFLKKKSTYQRFRNAGKCF